MCKIIKKIDTKEKFIKYLEYLKYLKDLKCLKYLEYLKCLKYLKCLVEFIKRKGLHRYGASLFFFDV